MENKSKKLKKANKENQNEKEAEESTRLKTKLCERKEIKENKRMQNNGE
jgi:hypothetical protein